MKKKKEHFRILTLHSVTVDVVVVDEIVVVLSILQLLDKRFFFSEFFWMI